MLNVNRLLGRAALGSEHPLQLMQHRIDIIPQMHLSALVECLPCKLAPLLASDVTYGTAFHLYIDYLCIIQ